MSTGHRHLEIIYCDDIREEVGNKVSYMGVYAGEMTVPSVPVMLPKLCLAVKVSTDLADPFQSLEVRVVKGEDEVELLATGPVPLPYPPPVSEIEQGTARFNAQLAIVLSPFQIDEETVIWVKAITEREELRCDPLRIRVLQSGAPVVSPQELH